MAAVLSIKNQAHIEVDGCDEVIDFISNEVESHFLNIELKKRVNCIWAIHGKNLTYCVDIINRSTAKVPDVRFRDTLDLGVQYVSGSFMVNGTPQTPSISGQTLTYLIPNLDLNQTITICFEVKVL
jgi:uncharacterized repeat protein (TIGR01451 family)